MKRAPRATRRVQRLSRHRADLYAFDRSVTPRLRVRPGETFVLETQDAAAGQLVSERQSPLDRRGLDVTPPLANPVAGPVHIAGVKQGDLLRIAIRRIDVSHRQSVTYTSGRGPLRDSARWGGVDAPRVHVLRHHVGPSGTMVDGDVEFGKGLTWPASPFIGTIGVAPEREVFSTLLGQGPFGGNLDCRDMRAGSALWLNAQVDGGRLFVGDVHASQGDMEFTGVAAETEGVVELSVDNLGQKRIPFPRIETEDRLIALYAARPLEHALTSAVLCLMEWLVDDYGVDPGDAYLQMSTNPCVRANVYQMLPHMRLDFVVGVEMPKAHARRLGAARPAAPTSPLHA